MNALLLAVLFGLAACGQAPSSGTASPAPSPTASVTVSVSVSVSADHYAHGAMIQVTVLNRLDRTIFTEDFQTECTIVTLQRSSAGGWQDVTGCAMGRPTRIVRLDPGASQAVELAPASIHLRGQGIGAGTYRVRFTYRLGEEAGGQFEVHSAEFQVS